jgi:hypothetical protein
MRKIISYLALILFGVVVGLLIAEGSLRVLRNFRPVKGAEEANPWEKYVGWAPGLNQFDNKQTREYDVLIRYNSKGLHDVEHSYEKPAHTYRILILGDSYVDGRQVELDQLFTRILEDLLNEKAGAAGVHFEVISAGVSGWGTDQQLLYYENEGYKYSPDMVMLAFVPNDVGNNYPPIEIIHEGCIKLHKPYFTLENGELVLHQFPYPIPQEPPGTLRSFLAQHSVAYRSFNAMWADYMEDLREDNEQENSKECRDPNPDPLVFAEPSPPEFEPAWQTTEALLERLKDDVDERGSKFVVAAQSTSFVTHPELREKTFEVYGERVAGVNWDWEKPYRRLETILEKLQVPLLNLSPHFVERAARTGEQLHYFRDRHYTPPGNQFAAELICDWLLDEELVPVTK